MNVWIASTLFAALMMAVNAFAAKPQPQPAEVLPATGHTVGGPGLYIDAPGTSQVLQVVPLSGYIFTPCITVSNKGSAAATLEARYPSSEPFVTTFASGSTGTACFEDDAQPPTEILLDCADGVGECKVFWRLDSLR